MSTELKPCLFCGGQASAPHGRNYRRAISCKNCDACAYADTDAKTIAAWNRRAPSPDMREAVNLPLAPDWERIAFNLCAEFGPEFVSDKQAFVKAAVREYLRSLRPSIPGPDAAIDTAYEAAKEAMPHEALIEIAPGELERVVIAAVNAALRSLTGAVEEQCSYCNGTGDVHRADGEWLGTCTCAAGRSLTGAKP